MTKIKLLVDQIDEELCGAKHYAECYVESKAKGDSVWANRYKEMANDELRHATWIHERAVQEIQEVERVFQAPEEMKEKWTKSHVKYVEKEAWIKQMLAM